MSERVADFVPSISEARAAAWRTLPPRPWRRLAARICDCWLAYLGVCTMVGILTAVTGSDVLVRALAGEHLNRWARFALSEFALIYAGLVMGLLAHLNGGSVGKWIFGLRVIGRNGGRLSLRLALRREFLAFVEGLALGLPLFALFTGFGARSALLKNGATSWDQRCEADVQHRSGGLVRMILGSAAVFATMAGVVAMAFA